MTKSVARNASIFESLPRAEEAASPAPKRAPDKKIVRPTLYLPASVNRTIKDLANARGIKAHDILKEAISKYLIEQGCEPWPEDE
jgi:hypothetical protein